MLSLFNGRLLALGLFTLTLPTAFGQAVRLNEVAASNLSVVRGDGSISDWVELVNTTGASVDLSGAMFTNDELTPDKWVVPQGVSIPANGFLVIACDSERPASTSSEAFLNTGFNLKASGADLYLYDFNGIALDTVSFGAQVGDLTIGRVAGAWKLCSPTMGAANVAVELGAQTSLRVNEWFANGSGNADDWFEVYNTDTKPVSLEGLFFTDVLAVKNTSPVPALTFIGTGAQAYAKFIADGNTDKGPEHVAFALRAAGEAVGIFNGAGATIDSITFGAQQQNVSEGRLPDGNAFITTFPGTASAGRANYRAIPNVWVNELLSHTDPPLEDAVEFYNNTDTPLDIGGWYLSNKESELKRYRIPNGTVIPARGFKVFYENDFNFTNPLIPFNFNSAHGDQVYLAKADANGNLTGDRVGEEFEAAENPVSFGRVTTSVAGDYKFVAMSSLTFGVSNPIDQIAFRQGTGASNSAPKIGPIIINEVMFNPASIDGSDNRDDEFIELYNITGNPVALYDVNNPENRWRLQNGVSFIFPANRTIPAFGYALVVSFSPSLEPILASNFRAKWGVPAGVALYGPFQGDLNNDGDSLELYKADAPQLPPHPDAGFVPYIRVDKVNYTDRAPWPPSADGTGFSLQRKNPLFFGNDPINWDGAAPTPGRANSEELRDTDGDGMPDVWEDLNGFDKNNAADAALNFDGDRFTNLQEFIAGTNPKDANSYLRVTGFVSAKSEFDTAKITFMAAANKTYSVLYRNSLAINSSWQKLANVAAEAGEHSVTVEDPNAFVRVDRYYQIVTPAAD
jgi:hypothetical protein